MEWAWRSSNVIFKILIITSNKNIRLKLFDKSKFYKWDSEFLKFSFQRDWTENVRNTKILTLTNSRLKLHWDIKIEDING